MAPWWPHRSPTWNPTNLFVGAVRLECKKTKRSIDLGCGGFLRLRRKVAELCGEEMLTYYQLMLDSLYRQFNSPDEKEKFWENYDEAVGRLVTRKRMSTKVVNVLYDSDSEGRATYGTCKILLKIIGDYDDNILDGYAARTDCARFRDFKAILEDCVRTKSTIVWY